MLNSRLARDQVTENLHVTERTLLPTFLNRLAAVRLKIEQERLEESLIKKVTRAVPVAVRVARHPLLERHGALHVGRLVLNMSKYLIRLSNTSANDHQRVRMTRRPHAGHSNQGRPCSSQTTRTGFPLIKIFGACLASRHPPWSPHLSRVTASSANAPMRLSLNASRRSRFSTRRSAGKQDS